MAVYQICFKPLQVPSKEKTFKVGQIYQHTSQATDKMQWDICLEKKGIYKIEYWAVNDMGIETAKRVVEVESKGFVEPKPMQGARFEPPFAAAQNELALVKNNVRIIFKKHPERFGDKLDWKELDLSGLQIGQANGKTFIDIKIGSWLSRKLNNDRCVLEVHVKNGTKLFCDSLLMTNADGTLVTNIPSSYKGLVAKSWRKGNTLCLLIRQAGLFIVE